MTRLINPPNQPYQSRVVTLLASTSNNKNPVEIPTLANAPVSWLGLDDTRDREMYQEKKKEEQGLGARRRESRESADLVEEVRSPATARTRMPPATSPAMSVCPLSPLLLLVLWPSTWASLVSPCGPKIMGPTQYLGRTAKFYGPADYLGLPWAMDHGLADASISAASSLRLASEARTRRRRLPGLLAGRRIR